MFFALNTSRATLSDLNEDLVNAFTQVKVAPAELANRLSCIPSSEKVYHMLRAITPRATSARAVRFIYLNRHCWGGLYRENKMGQFNVPYGNRSHSSILNRRVIQLASESLRGSEVRLYHGDFSRFVASARAGDVVYCDPTYREGRRSRFDRYGRDVFTWNDQERLARAARRAADRGAVVVVSNAPSSAIWDLYPGSIQVSVVRRQGIAPGLPRSHRTENLFILDPERRWSDWSGLGPTSVP